MEEPKWVKVTSVKQLEELVDQGCYDYTVKLNYGCRSSKFINRADDNKFYVFNLIDDSEHYLTADELEDENKTNIGKAIRQGAFFAYLDEREMARNRLNQSYSQAPEKQKSEN